MDAVFGDGWNKIEIFAKKSTSKAIERGLTKVAEKVRTDIGNNIKTGGSVAGKSFLANHPITVFLKGFNKPWSHYGLLIRNLLVRRGTNKRFVGWEGRSGFIASVVELGAVVPVTEAMRGWFAARGIFLRATTTAIKIPPRYNLYALAEKYRANPDELAAPMYSEVGKEYR
jgi:hypothetical protein